MLKRGLNASRVKYEDLACLLFCAIRACPTV